MTERHQAALWEREKTFRTKKNAAAAVAVTADAAGSSSLPASSSSDPRDERPLSDLLASSSRRSRRTIPDDSPLSAIAASSSSRPRRNLPAGPDDLRDRLDDLLGELSD